ERVAGPMEVVEDDRRRTGRREFLQVTPEPPEQLLPGCDCGSRCSDERRKLRLDQRQLLHAMPGTKRVVELPERLLVVVCAADACLLPDDLRKRKPRALLAVREA